MEFEIRLPSGWSFLQGGSDYGEQPFHPTAETEFYSAHRVSVGSANEFPALVAQLQTDLWNIFGVPPPELAIVDFGNLLK